MIGNPDHEYRTVKQIAEYLNLSASVIYRLCVTKKLGHYRFGEGAGAIRIKRSDLMEFVQRGRVEQADGAVHYVPPKTAPYVLKHITLDRRPPHPCGAMTNVGTPCEIETRQERCHLHRRTS
jgi:excisionase family DNA binding protein